VTKSSRGRRRSSAADAFTLLETLIAMMLMGMVLAALATITTQWMPNWNYGMARLQRNEQLSLALERLAADLSAAEFISASREAREPYFQGAERSIIFVRTAIGPNAELELELIRIAEVTSEQGPVLVRTRAPFASPAGRRWQPNFANPVVLVRPPYRLAFSYAGADRAWRETWSRQVRLPTAIKLIIQDHTNQKNLPSTIVTLRVGIPQSCIVAKSFEECLTALQSKDPKARS
jgi:general secretion pathway protein J